MMSKKMCIAVLIAVSLRTGACGDSETEGNDTDGLEETDSTGDSDDFGDACIDNYDANAPALRFRAVVPTAPKPLADISSGTQKAIDDETLIYLLSMDDLSEVDTVSGTFGVGEKADAENTYRFTDDSTAITFEMDGDSFTSTGVVETVLVVPLVEDQVAKVPLKEVTLDGTFTTEAHCAVGTQTESGPPTEWTPGGEMAGLLTVEDAKAVSITVAGRTFSLCAYLAYGMAAVLPSADAACAAEVSEWDNPPDSETTDGESAWRVAADIAATAVYIE